MRLLLFTVWYEKCNILSTINKCLTKRLQFLSLSARWRMYESTFFTWRFFVCLSSNKTWGSCSIYPVFRVSGAIKARRRGYIPSATVKIKLSPPSSIQGCSEYMAGGRGDKYVYTYTIICMVQTPTRREWKSMMSNVTSTLPCYLDAQELCDYTYSLDSRITRHEEHEGYTKSLVFPCCSNEPETSSDELYLSLETWMSPELLRLR